MEGALERVLRLVADGRLTADEAGPILDALGPGEKARREAGAAASAGAAAAAAAEAELEGGTSPRFARLEVRDGGKRVVDLRIPVSLGRLALNRIPGIPTNAITDVEAAIARGTRGPILDVEDADGDGVRIVLE